MASMHATKNGWRLSTLQEISIGGFASAVFGTLRRTKAPSHSRRRDRTPRAAHIVENNGGDRFTPPFRTGIILMALALSNESKALLDGPNFAHLATLMPDGSPQSVPVWVGREEDHVLICTGEGSLKAKNIRRDPRVALSIVDFHDPYKEAQLRGRVVERRPDGDFRYMDPISHKYTGKPFPFRSPEGRVALVIEIDKERYTKLPFEHTPPK
jgi:PPOX class probable F420-dependent enzyme